MQKTSSELYTSSALLYGHIVNRISDALLSCTVCLMHSCTPPWTVLGQPWRRFATTCRSAPSAGTRSRPSAASASSPTLATTSSTSCSARPWARQSPVSRPPTMGSSVSSKSPSNGLVGLQYHKTLQVVSLWWVFIAVCR